MAYNRHAVLKTDNSTIRFDGVSYSELAVFGELVDPPSGGVIVGREDGNIVVVTRATDVILRVAADPRILEPGWAFLELEGIRFDIADVDRLSDRASYDIIGTLGRRITV